MRSSRTATAAVEVFHRPCHRRYLRPTTCQVCTSRVHWRAIMSAGSAESVPATRLKTVCLPSVPVCIRSTLENIPVLTSITDRFTATTTDWAILAVVIGIVPIPVRGSQVTLPVLGHPMPFHLWFRHLVSSLSCLTVPNLRQSGNGKVEAWSLMMLGLGHRWRNGTWTWAGAKSTSGRQRVQRMRGASAAVMQLHIS